MVAIHSGATFPQSFVSMFALTRFLNAICSFGFLDALDEVNEAVRGVEESVRKLVRNIFAYCKKNTYLPFDLVLLLRSQV